MGELAIELERGLKNAPPNASDEELRQQFANLREPLLRLSKCPAWSSIVAITSGPPSST
jgi:hypothetical protein